MSFKTKAIKKTYNFFKDKTDKKENYLKLYYFWLPNRPNWTPNYPTRGFFLFTARLLKLKKYYSLGIWVVDDKDTLKWSIDNDIKFITTNDPELCKTVLSENNLIF